VPQVVPTCTRPLLGRGCFRAGHDVICEASRVLDDDLYEDDDDFEPDMM